MGKIKLLSILAVIALFVSCETESENGTPQENIVGKWMITNMELLGMDIPGDGSYLEFKECATECGGIDYEATDGTSGSFTYELNESATVISITDTMAEGGAYNGDWDILELSATKFRIVGNTILGSMKLEMTKQ